MTHKSKKPAAKPSKSRLGAIGYLDDENFYWMRNMRTPEEKKRDAELIKELDERLQRDSTSEEEV